MNQQFAIALVAVFLAGIAPVPAALHLAQNCACTWPPGTLDHSLITSDKAMVEPSNISTKMTIGGSLISMTAGDKTAGGLVTVGGNYDPYSVGQWSFNKNPNPKEPVKQDISTIFDWSHFEGLARSIIPGQYPAGQADNECDDFYVFVLTKGGTFNLASFYTESSGCAEQARGEDNGRTLVVFNTSAHVALTGYGGRQFGPSVLAPFSTVTLADNAGFMDGFLIAKNAMLFGTENEMHGDSYKGPSECKCPAKSKSVNTQPLAAPPPVVNTPTTSPPTMSPTMSTVTGDGDPHLVNVRSEHFDLMQPGNYTFLVLPRGAKESKAVLQLRAHVSARGDVCEGKFYITGLNITGSWLGTVGHLYLSTSGETLNRSREVLGLSIASSRKMSPEDFVAALPPTMVKASQPEAHEVRALNQHVTMLSVTLKFGPGVIMRVDWEHQKQKVGFSNWLKLSSWGLSRAQMKVGGLLGEDDHQSVMDLPQECSKSHGSSTLLRKPNQRKANGMVAASASMDIASDIW